METIPAHKLVDAEGLLQSLFDKQSRPSIRWVRAQQKRRAIPFMRVGRLIRFDVAQVRAALETKFTVQPRKEAA